MKNNLNFIDLSEILFNFEFKKCKSEGFTLWASLFVLEKNIKSYFKIKINFYSNSAWERIIIFELKIDLFYLDCLIKWYN